MAKTITEQIEELEHENQRLKEIEKDLEKFIDKAIKARLGMSIKEVENAMKRNNKLSEFEYELSKYFQLKSTNDKRIFLSIICSDATKNFYRKKLTEYVDSEAENVTD